ncbi:MSP domain protein [Opisthorchis viverrini]|uniref:MSP domain protein n=1 Tax=Opisthorchis viverrini TaxID=6198 RepID=A0A1S8WPY8_OPIVI|nr:MSP domain protein [Opisthorchis viverrini]
MSTSECHTTNNQARDEETELVRYKDGSHAALYTVRPFTDVVTSHIQLTNLQDQSVCFKVKTTVPKRYCVRPSSGVLKPHERLNVAVMLQPFNYDPAEKAKHKFMIQSMPMPDGDSTTLEEVWQYAHPNKIRDSKLICVLRLPGELVVEPSHDLVFEGPFNKPSSATVTLTNPSREQMWFKLHVFSQKLSASPVSAVLQPNESVKVTGNYHPPSHRHPHLIPHSHM